MRLCPELKGLDEVGSWDLEPQEFGGSPGSEHPPQGRAQENLSYVPPCKACPRTGLYLSRLKSEILSVSTEEGGPERQQQLALQDLQGFGKRKAGWEGRRGTSQLQQQ